MFRDFTVRHLVLIILVLLVPLGVWHAADPPALRAAGAKPPVWAVYYAWYEVGTGPHGRWRMWSDDKSTTANPKPNSKAQPVVYLYQVS